MPAKPPPKAPIDEFFDAVQNPASQPTILTKNPIKRPNMRKAPGAVKVPRAPKYVAKPAKVQRPPGMRSKPQRALPVPKGLTAGAVKSPARVRTPPAKGVRLFEHGARASNLPYYVPDLPGGVAVNPKNPNQPGLVHYVPPQVAGKFGTVVRNPGQNLYSDRFSMGLADILNVPVGIGLAGVGLGQDINAAVRGHPGFTHTRATGRGLYEGMKQTVEHPGRDPIGTALLASSVLSGGATGAGRLLGVAGKLGEGDLLAAGKALAKKPPPGPRVMKLGNFETRGLYSRNSAAELAQRGHDLIVSKLAEAKPGSRAYQYWAGRLGREESKNRMMRTARGNAPADLLDSHHVTIPQQMALRSYAENHSPAARIAAHDEWSKTATPSDRARLAVKSRLLKLAQSHVTTDASGDVQFVGGKTGVRGARKDLPAIYKQLEAAAGGREQTIALLKANEDAALQAQGKSSNLARTWERQSAGRVNAPARIVAGAEYRTVNLPKGLLQQKARVVSLQRRVDELAGKVEATGLSHADRRLIASGARVADPVPKLSAELAKRGYTPQEIQRAIEIGQRSQSHAEAFQTISKYMRDGRPADKRAWNLPADAVRRGRRETIAQRVADTFNEARGLPLRLGWAGSGTSTSETAGSCLRRALPDWTD